MSMYSYANQPDNGLIVAIDGPSGTGKSTVSRTIAQLTGSAYLDTGAMYRVATLHVLTQGIDPADTEAVIAATASLPLEVNDDPQSTEVLLDGQDVQRAIRGAEVTGHVSTVAAIPEVRENLVALQRRLAFSAGRCIVEGRDIGTVVLPDAPVKIYMTAAAEVRAQRRHDQNLASGRASDYAQVLADVVERDRKDSSRAASPLRPADDAVVLDTGSMTIDEVVAAIGDLIRRSSDAFAAGEIPAMGAEAPAVVDDGAHSADSQGAVTPAGAAGPDLAELTFRTTDGTVVGAADSGDTAGSAAHTPESAPASAGDANPAATADAGLDELLSKEELTDEEYAQLDARFAKGEFADDFEDEDGFEDEGGNNNGNGDDAELDEVDAAGPDVEYVSYDTEDDWDDEEWDDDLEDDFDENTLLVSGEDTDWEAVEAAFGVREQIITEPLCTVAIVGRPNVGKSTLVNRILGRREAVVEDFPGVTRDRISYLAEWNGVRFWVQDTGGWDPDAKGMAASIARQAEAAMDSADVIVLVVDSKVGITTSDEMIARKLQRADQPVIVVANKFDSDNQYADVAEFWGLGLGYPYPVSAQHGRGGADVLDEVVKALPEEPRQSSVVSGPRRVALVGKPNVGKSSLLNKLTGENRAVVDNVAGTTVDPVDSQVQLAERTWTFVDTAGIRKKTKTAQGHEYYAGLRTKGAIDKAEVVVFLLDASEPITEQDQRVLRMILDSGRALVLAYNKWDLMDEDRRDLLEREIEMQLAHVPWARRINISAQTGRAVQKLEPALIEALENWDKRVPTGQLNNWLRAVIAQTPPPMRGGRLPRVLFATQASSRPPVIVLFTTGFLEHGYRRFLERKFRETFGFEGSPVRIAVRVRERRGKK